MKKKILMITTVAVTLEAFLLPHAERLKAKGWQVDCLANGAANSDKCAETFDHCHEIGWGRSPFAIKNLTTYPVQIAELVKREKYDVVHVHTPVASFVTRYALRNLRKKTGTKVIYTAHGFHFYKGGNPVKNAIYLTLEKLASRWTNHLVVINEEDYTAATKYLMPRNRVTWSKNGIGLDAEYYSAKAVPKEAITEVRKSLDLTDDDVLFTMIAEFNPGKRHADLIKAFSMVKNKKAHLALLGKGPLMEDTKEKCKKLKINDRVHFTGLVPDVRPYILASKATILTSEREGLPRSVMESLALGIPVIGADARGTRDLLKDGRGWLVKTGDTKAISERIKKVINYDKNLK